MVNVPRPFFRKKFKDTPNVFTREPERLSKSCLKKGGLGGQGCIGDLENGTQRAC
jgi:hypothetical protein